MTPKEKVRCAYIRDGLYDEYDCFARTQGEYAEDCEWLLDLVDRLEAERATAVADAAHWYKAWSDPLDWWVDRARAWKALAKQQRAELRALTSDDGPFDVPPIRKLRFKARLEGDDA